MKSRPSTRAFPYSRTILRTIGPFNGTVQTPIRRVIDTVCTLRIRCDAPVSVELWRRPRSVWSVVYYDGQDIQHMMGLIASEDMKLVVSGTANGVVELV